MKKIFALVTAGALALSLSACQASSQQTTDTTTKSADSTDTAAAKNDGSFPSETITLVCPFSAGGGTDIGARNLAQALSKVMGVNVVVENQTGSGGWVAWTDLIQGDYKDGYTIGLINHNYAMGELDPDNPRKYNLDDVTVLANQALDYNVMAIRSNDTRFSDINSFIEYAKSNPVLVSAQATGITDGDATTAEWFNKTFGTQITVVPVDGASDSRGMFLSGDTDIFFASISDVMASYQSGEMKVACIFSDERSDFIPDVPTIKEATGEDFVAFAARGYFYPNGVPQDIVDTTNPLGDFIAAHDNHERCFGIIGSGNRNFNNQYCLTAKQYSQRFGFPMLGDFELRGTQSDIERLAPIILEAQKNFNQR